MRFIGFFFLLLAISALAWDVWHILNGGGIHSFSGITAIWNSLDKGSFPARCAEPDGFFGLERNYQTGDEHSGIPHLRIGRTDLHAQTQP